MKKIFLALVALAFMAVGCTKFLDLPAQNQRTIVTIDDVRIVLNGYLRGVDASLYSAANASMAGSGPIPLFSSNMIRMFEAYSDNIDANAAMPIYIAPTSRYGTWQEHRRVFLWNDYATAESIWNGYYTGVGFLNTLIYELDNIAPGDQADEWNRVMGEMKTLRSFYLFKLLQYFAPYGDNAQGIPVYLDTAEGVLGVKPARATHSEVYKIILDDLSEAERLLGLTAPRSTFNIFWRTDRLPNLMAQVYWFKADSPAAESTDWANAAKYAQMIVSNVPEDVIPRTGSQMLMAYYKNGRIGYPGHFIAAGGSGMLLAIYGSTYAGYGPEDIPASQELYDLYQTGDVRLGAELSNGGTPDDDTDGVWDGAFIGRHPVINTFWKGVTSLTTTSLGSSTDGRVILFKPEEAYLILAEALHHTGGNAGAVLDKFKSFRNAGGTGKTGEALLQEIMNERRKEFFMDGDHRWLDLKKYGGVTITRNLTFPESEQQIYDGNTNPLYKAVPGGYQYALPIPMSELQENTNLTQNPGWTGQLL